MIAPAAHNCVVRDHTGRAPTSAAVPAGVVPPATRPATCRPAFTPGQYLARRRAMAGLSLDQAVSGLLALPEARLSQADGTRFIAPEARLALAARLVDAEADNGFLPPAHAELVARVYAFDPAIYAALFAAANAFYPVSPVMAVPHLCPSCACSWCDPCFTVDAHGNPGTCGWSTTHPGLCTACAAEVG